MVSFGQLLRLKPGCEQEYKRRHDELWPELAYVMKEAGINMVIFRHEELLFLYATAPSREAWEYVDKHEITPRWDRYMSDILQCDGERPVVTDLPQMFAFGDLR